MLFTDPFFLFVFLPLLLLFYYTIPNRFRNALLTVTSLVFYYIGEYQFFFWLIGSILLNYVIARGIEKTRGTPTARKLLILGITSDLLLLLIFKYTSFILLIFMSYGIPAIALPLGISFFTFHKISYKIDVYRGTCEAKKDLLDLALYILFFPQLIAGPIIRYKEIAADIVTRNNSVADFSLGVRRFIFGLGKKMIIANNVAIIADQVFNIPSGFLPMSTAWLGILCYTLQIYFDFSGYSDMAIGLGLMFGFHFPENFDHPYKSRSITEFWRRWHMSLSRWFKDYLYIPLGGNRCATWRIYVNLCIVFFLCGLWHGAAWNFVVWGIFHGCLLIIERIKLTKILDRCPLPIAHLYTILMVMIGWVFFRANTLEYAMGYLQSMFGMTMGREQFYDVYNYLNKENLLIIPIGIAASLPIRQPLFNWMMNAKIRLVKVASYAIEGSMLLIIFIYSISFTAAGTYNPFIYFRF